jgi:hypothetical protein
MKPRARMARLAGLCIFTVLCAALVACAGAKTQLTSGAAEPLPGLPGIPLDVAGHGTSDVQNSHIDGTGYFTASPGVIPQGTNLLLFTGETNPPSLEWAIYKYDPDEAANEVVSDIDFAFTVNTGPNGWIGIANYGAGQWEFAGPFNDAGGGPAKSFSNLDAGGYTSPAGNLYFIVAAYNGSTVSVNGLDITSDVTPPATFSISGRAIDNSTSQGIPGVQVTLNPGNLTIGTDANGDYIFSGLSTADYTVSAAPVAGYDPFVPPTIFITNLTADSTGNEFTADPLVTYETGAGILKQKIDTYCIGCHSPTGGDEKPYLRNWADLVFYDEDFPQGSFAKLVDMVTEFDEVEQDYLMPDIGSDEADEINANNDRHWFTDWEAGGYMQ